MDELSAYLSVFCEKEKPLEMFTPGFAGFSAAPPTLKIPAAAPVSHSYPLELVQAFLRAKGFKGKNKKALTVDDAWGANTAFALDSFDAALAKQRGTGAKLAKVWSYSKATNNVTFEPAVGNMLRAWAAADPTARPILADAKIRARLPADMGATAPTVGATTPTPAEQKKAPLPGFNLETVSGLQQIVRALGVNIKNDSIYGSGTRDAWLYVATLYKLEGRSFPEGKNRAWVNPNTFATLKVKSRNGPGPSMGIADVRKKLLALAAAPKPAAAPAAPAAPTPIVALKTVSARDLQKILLGLGVKGAGLSDGKWGPSTRAAWESEARKLTLNPLSAGKTGATTAQVAQATYMALLEAAKATVSASTAAKAVAKPAPAKPAVPAPAGGGKPVDPRKSGMSKVDVGAVQDIVIKLGWKKVKRDGGWGPQTATAWNAAATRRKLDGAIDRASPTEAWVMPETFRLLSVEGGFIKPQPGAAAEAKPTPAPGPAPTPAPLAPGKPVDVVQVTPNQTGLILTRFGVTKPTTSLAYQLLWAMLANQESSPSTKLDPYFNLLNTGKVEVSKATFDKLADASAKQEQVKELVALATVALPVVTLQQAIRAANTKSPVAVTGTWDGPTETAFFQVLKIPANTVQVWERALPKLVGSAKKSIMVTPAQAAQAGQLAKTYQNVVAAAANEKKLASFQRVTKIFLVGLLNDADLMDAAIPETSTLAQLKPLYQKMAKALGGSLNTEMTPGSNANEVFLHKNTIKAFENAASGAINALVNPAVVRATDRVTIVLVKQALMQIRAAQEQGKISGPVIPKLNLKSSAWEPSMTQSLKGVVGAYVYPGLKTVDPKVWEMTVNRLRELGGAGLMRMPSDAAKALQARAAEYVAAQGPSKEMVPAPDVTITVPAGGGVVRGEVVPITGRVEAPAPAAALAPLPLPTAVLPPVFTPQEDLEPEPQPFVSPTPVPQGENIQVPVIETPEGPRSDIDTGATSAAGGAGGGANITGPSITGPSININMPSAEPTPVAPVQASAGGGAGLLIGMAFAGLIGAMIFGGDRNKDDGSDRA